MRITKVEISSAGNHKNLPLNMNEGVYASLSVVRNDSLKLFNIVKDYLRQVVTDQTKFVKPEDYHTTLIYSKVGNVATVDENRRYSIEASIDAVEMWDTHDTVLVAKLNSPELQLRHKQLMKKYNFSWDYPDYKPHVSLVLDTVVGKSDIIRLNGALRGRKINLNNECFASLED